MTAPLCFIDTETTGLNPDRRVWEVAVIRREDGEQAERTWQVSDVDLSNAEPMGLKIGRFYERHAFYGDVNGASIAPERVVAGHVEEATRGAHLVGAVPSFDADCLDKMLRRHQLIPAWHYHLIDVEALAVGWLCRERKVWADRDEDDGGLGISLDLPWKSDALSHECGVRPPSEDERHTALGDARWAMRLYDAITGSSGA